MNRTLKEVLNSRVTVEFSFIAKVQSILHEWESVFPTTRRLQVLNMMARIDKLETLASTPAQDVNADLLAAAKDFCAKVERGEARSSDSYQKFKSAIANAEATQPPELPYDAMRDFGTDRIAPDWAVCGLDASEWEQTR